MQDYIDGCNKESGKNVAYPEYSTVNFENVVNITVDSDGITPHSKKDRIKENHQKDCNIPYYKIRQIRELKKTRAKN